MAPVKQAVLVTGAAGGVGSAVVGRFARTGWETFGIDVRQQPEHSVADGWCVADLRQVDECRRAVGECVAAAGRLDCVVNAAGVWTEGPSEVTTEEEWDRVVDLNLKALYFVSSAAIPHLRQTGGCICNLSSDAGIQGNAGAAVYCASKGGVSNLTRALALELAPSGVRVNAVCPGDIDTPMLAYQANTFGGGDPEGYLRRLRAGYPQGDAARFLRRRGGRRADLVPRPTERGGHHRRQPLDRLRPLRRDRVRHRRSRLCGWSDCRPNSTNAERLASSHVELALDGVDHDRVAVADLAVEDQDGRAVADLALDHPLRAAGRRTPGRTPRGEQRHRVVGDRRA